MQDLDITLLSPAEQERMKELLQLEADHKKYNAYEQFIPMDWQREYVDMGEDLIQRAVIAANRTGKSYIVAFELSMHLTGLYPSWWTGKRYEKGINAWLVGESAEQMAAPEGIQEHVFGPFHDVGAGFIPKSNIQSWKPTSGVRNSVKTAVIEHVSGTQSRLDLKTYSQGSGALMGASLQAIVVDEEPTNPDIYGQLVTRIAAACEDGRLLLSFTPENGMTPLVNLFFDETAPQHPGLLRVTIEDAHVDKGGYLTDKDITRMYDNTPVIEHDMRLRGIPKMGGGAVYPVLPEDFTVDPFPIPEHWLRCSAIDFGWTHPTGMVWVALDSDTDCVYVYHVEKMAKTPVPVLASILRGKGSQIPVVWPHDGLNGTLAGGGSSLASQFTNEGVAMEIDPFKNPMDQAGKQDNRVQPGLTEILTRLQTGRFKVFSTCTAFFNEYETYQYDPKKEGQVIKRNDDLMDATRYATLSIIQGIGTTSSDNGWGATRSSNSKSFMDEFDDSDWNKPKMIYVNEEAYGGTIEYDPTSPDLTNEW